MTKMWFKAKTYGWGWTPSTWQGWAVIILFVGISVYSFLSIDKGSHSVSDTLIQFVPILLFNIAMLLVICYLTGETPRWRWGNKK